MSHRSSEAHIRLMQSDIGFTFTGFILVLPILVLIIYAIGKFRRADPSKRRKYAALGLIVILIISISTIVVLNIPLPRRIELDITLDFRSNSTDHQAVYQYHWDAPGIRTDVYGKHIDWNEQYGDAHSYGSGILNELLLDIDRVAAERDRPEFSISKAGQYANDFLNDLGIEN